MKTQVATETLVDKYDLGEFIQPLKVKPAFGLEQALEGMVGCERVAVAEAFFPTIDPKFLEMSHEKPSIAGKLEGKNFKIFLPRFSPYPYFENGNITLDMKGIFYSYKGFNSTIEHKVKIHPNLSPIFERHLKEGISWDGIVPGREDDTREGYYSFQLKGNFHFTHSSYFNGAVPRHVKQKVSKYKQIFGDNFFIVSEAEWVEEESQITTTKDPLLVGTIGNRVYLLDQFNCTPLEYQMAKQMTTNPKGRRVEPCSLN